LQAQAATQAYIDVFYITGFMALGLIPAALFMKRPDKEG
jgi:hypothetical protein